MEDLMENITDKEMEMLNNCKTEDEWNNACNTVKKARRGTYPRDWFQKVILSGMINKVLGQGSDQIKIS